jgi:2OG-Fe(II) oxygenase superfamily
MFRTAIRMCRMVVSPSIPRGGGGGGGDAMVATLIPMGCVGVLVEAYFRTENEDADSSLQAQFLPSDDCIDPKQEQQYHHHHQSNSNNSIVQRLERDGIVIIPNAISSNVITAARKSIQELQRMDHSNFQTSSNDDDIRQDTIAWVRASDSIVVVEDTVNNNSNNNNQNSRHDIVRVSEGAIPPQNHTSRHGLDYCIRFLRGIPHALEKSGYSTSQDHLVPKQCQLAIYPGDGNASYARHLDHCNASVFTLGLLEWLRLSDYRRRRITMILYLNDPDRPTCHGGALRCWVAKASHCEYRPTIDDDVPDRETFYPSFDIQPTGGTLVIFQSQR